MGLRFKGMTLRLIALNVKEVKHKWSVPCLTLATGPGPEKFGAASNLYQTLYIYFHSNWSLKLPHQALVPAFSHVSVHLFQFSLHPLDHGVVQPYVPFRKLVSVSLDVVWMGGIVSGGYKAPWEPVKVRAVIEGQRWGGGKNQSTKLRKDKKEESKREWGG